MQINYIDPLFNIFWKSHSIMCNNPHKLAEKITFIYIIITKQFYIPTRFNELNISVNFWGS